MGTNKTPMKLTLHLTLIFIFLSGCTQKFFKAAQIKRTPLKSNSYVPLETEHTYRNRKSTCIETIFLFPNKTKINKEELYSKICPGSENIYNIDLARKFYIIPLIYAKDCFVLTADCGL